MNKKKLKINGGAGKAVLNLAVLTFAVLSLLTAGAQTLSARQSREPISPGPKGNVLTGKDLRVPLTWLTQPGNHGPGDYARELYIGGRERYYEFHIPSGYQKKQPLPVVLILHGGGGYAAVMRNMTGMDSLADKEGFIAVYPAATGLKYTDRLLYWSDGRPYKNPAHEADDAGYIQAVLEDLAKFFSVNQKRIYATGMSNGAMMTFQLAAYLPQRIAAIAPVSSQRSPGELAPLPPRAVPIMYFHGTQDRWAPYEGGRQSFAPHKPFVRKAVPQTIHDWVRHNQCSSVPQITRVGKAVRETYSSCAGNSEVIFWKLEGAGHTWPGGEVTRFEKIGKVGTVNKDISASQEMWEFFKRHSLP